MHLLKGFLAAKKLRMPPENHSNCLLWRFTTISLNFRYISKQSKAWRKPCPYIKVRLSCFEREGHVLKIRTSIIFCILFCIAWKVLFLLHFLQWGSNSLLRGTCQKLSQFLQHKPANINEMFVTLCKLTWNFEKEKYRSMLSGKRNHIFFQSEF